MYIVRLDNNKIYDQRVDDLTLIDPIVNLEENNAGSFTFTITSNHPYYDDIKRRKSLIQVFEDSDLIFSGMVYEIEEDFYKNRKIYCEGELSYLNDTIQRPAEYHNMTVRGLLETYINNHNAQVEEEKQFKVGMVTVQDDSIYCFTNMESSLSCIKRDLLDDLGGIIRVRHSNGEKYIDYITEIEVNTNDQVIRLGENLINYKSNISSLDIATAIIPLGKRLDTSPIEDLDIRLDIKAVNNGLDYVVDTESVNNFGWIYKTIVWDDVEVASELKKKGETYLENTQFDNLVIEVNALDMHLIDTYETPFRLSDQIRIVSKPHGLRDKYFRLTKQEINLNNPQNNTITLGKEEHISLSARTVQTNNEVLKAMESITPASTILKQAQENATQIIKGALGGYVVMNDTNGDGHPDEILIMDTDDPETATRVWRWNQNGLGYSNTGYNGSYGLAMTMDGSIVADYITTGKLVGLDINNGNGTFHVDVNGKVTASSAEIKGKVEATSGKIGGYNIEANKLWIGDSTLERDHIGCGSAGKGIVNIVGNKTSSNSQYGYIQISNSGNSEDCLDGIRIYGNGLVRRYDGSGNQSWEKWLSNIPNS